MGDLRCLSSLPCGTANHIPARSGTFPHIVPNDIWLAKLVRLFVKREGKKKKRKKKKVLRLCPFSLKRDAAR